MVLLVSTVRKIYVTRSHAKIMAHAEAHLETMNVIANWDFPEGIVTLTYVTPHHAKMVYVNPRVAHRQYAFVNRVTRVLSVVMK